MAQPALSSSSPCTYTYDVFLSFCGVDTRTGFTGHLYSALCQRGVLTFMDDDALSKGEEITPSLLKAIQKSRMAIVIFYKNYASSTFCLNELVHIIECYTKQKMWIWPVFYDVDPSHVRYQTGSYGEALSKHERGRFKDDIEKMQKWRLALRQAADLSGWHFQHGGEYEHVLIRKITENISNKLNRSLLKIADYPVGLEARMQNVLSIMGSEFDDKVNMIGIHGIGGIGKSTLARAIYNLVAYQFEGSCFVANIGEKSSTRHGPVQIQETMLYELVGDINIKLEDVNQGIPILKERLHRKKVLLILDGVDKKEQLQATAGGLDWFGFGSIIIITTRDKHLLDIHGIENLYEVEKFNDTEALRLFRWSALKNKDNDPSYVEIIKHAICYASGLPLALEAIGSNLFGKTLNEWKSAMEAYERIPNRDVQEILRVSYNGLEENEKEIFLDIACFFKGCTVKYVTEMLHARGFHPKYGIGVLEKKSLISLWRYNDEILVMMHDLIQYMGKEIVRQQSTWPEKRNRLWFYEDVICILDKNMENNDIEAMMLDIPEDKEFQWNPKVLGKMRNLRMLIKRNGCSFRSPKHLPNNLRVLEWWGYPAASLPSNFHLKNLVILNLSYSCFQWNKPLEKSKVLSQLIFTGCEELRQIPDVSGFPNLTKLCVDNCTNLIEIHDSAGFLDNLQSLSAKGCTKLRIVPHGIKLTSLEYLCLRDCSSLVIFPEILGPLEKLKFVDLEGTAIENLPLSMQNVQGLERLHLNRCKMIESNALSNIIQMLPNFFPFLKTLRLRDSNLIMLPACIEECRFLEFLDLCNCKQLQEIRGLPPSTDDFLAYNCTSLKAHCSTLNMLLSQAIDSTTRKFYILPGQRIPEWFDHSSKGNSLCFWFQKEFPSLTVGAVLGVQDNMEHPFSVNFNFYIKINDIEIPFLFDFNYFLETDHIFMLNYVNNTMNLDRERLASENEWNYGEVSFVIPPDSGCSGSIKWTGVYVNRACTRMGDVQFTNPFPPKVTCDDLGNQFDIEQQQQQQLALLNQAIPINYTHHWFPPFMHPYWEQPMDNLLSNIPSSKPASPIDRSNGLDGTVLDHQAKVPRESSQASGFAAMQSNQAQSPTPSSGQVRQEQHLGNVFMHPYWEQALDNVLSNIPSSKPASTIDRSNGLDGTDLAHQAKVPRESSQASGFAAMQSNQAQSPTPSSGQVRQEQHLGMEMEAFYSSLDAETHLVLRSHDKSATIAPSEEAREALKIIQDFFFNDYSVLLHPERCSVTKTSLEYLSKLSEDDGLSREMRTFISEASKEFTHWSKDYIEASKKIVSTASDLQKADELKTSLEGNKKKFREVVALENELLDKLACMKKSKKELEEQIQIINANISASESKKQVTFKRKRDIFEEGKKLKAQRDELRQKAPHLQHEHGLAKKTQTRIRAKWSKLRRKFKKIAADRDVQYYK